MQKINFQNLPNQTTPVNATNLNQLQTNVDNGKVETSLSTTITDLNNLIVTGFYYIGGASTNIPVSGYSCYVEVLKYNNNYILQKATRVSSNPSVQYERQKYNGTWTDWVQVSPPQDINNANGTAVKFADGTMICYLNIIIDTQAINSAYGNLYIGNYDWTFPVEFYTAPVVTCGCFLWGNGASWRRCKKHNYNLC